MAPRHRETAAVPIWNRLAEEWKRGDVPDLASEITLDEINNTVAQVMRRETTDRILVRRSTRCRVGSAHPAEYGRRTHWWWAKPTLHGCRGVTTKLTRSPLISLPLDPDQIGDSGPAIGYIVSGCCGATAACSRSDPHDLRAAVAS